MPQDPNGAWYTSGIRIGTPALTTRGLGAGEMDEIAGLIDTVLTGTRPAAAPKGGVSKAHYTLDAGVADHGRGAGVRPADRVPALPGHRPELI